MIDQCRFQRLTDKRKQLAARLEAIELVGRALTPGQRVLADELHQVSNELHIIRSKERLSK